MSSLAATVVGLVPKAYPISTNVYRFVTIGSRILRACMSRLLMCNGFSSCPGGLLFPQPTFQGVSKEVCHVRS
jgi:hypothetical protein